MKTWLLTWNQNLWPWDDPIDGYQEVRQEVETHGISFIKWTCGPTKSIMPEDRVFMIRLGAEPRGIFASGYAATPVFEGTHWVPEKAQKGIKARRIYVRLDKMLDFSKSIIPMEELHELSDAMNWSSQSSGISIPDDVAAALEEIWKKI